MHYLIKQLVPPFIHTIRWYSFKYGWKGDYPSYEAAEKEAGGYNADHILQRIIASTQKVQKGVIPYERDGIEYDTLKMNFNLLSTLLWIATQNNGALTVLDFGGSLGTTYHQQKPFLSGIKQLKWCIIEQPNYVAAGKTGFQTNELLFYNNIEECLAEQHPNLFLFSNVLQYIPRPYQLLEQVKNTGIPYLMIDFIGYINGNSDRIAIQHVPPIFYGVEASYPCWFFNKNKMLQWLEQFYTMQYDFISEPDKYYLGLQPFIYEGQVWKLNSAT